jgi:hypothetical protein
VVELANNVTIGTAGGNTIVIGRTTGSGMATIVVGDANSIVDLSQAAMIRYKDGLIQLAPEYKGSSSFGDGSNNNGTLSLEFDEKTLRNFYRFTTKEPLPQDHDILVSIPLPNDFAGFDDNKWQWLGADAEGALKFVFAIDTKGAECLAYDEKSASLISGPQACKTKVELLGAYIADSANGEPKAIEGATFDSSLNSAETTTLSPTNQTEGSSLLWQIANVKLSGRLIDKALAEEKAEPAGSKDKGGKLILRFRLTAEAFEEARLAELIIKYNRVEDAFSR